MIYELSGLDLRGKDWRAQNCKKSRGRREIERSLPVHRISGTPPPIGLLSHLHRQIPERDSRPRGRRRLNSLLLHVTFDLAVHNSPLSAALSARPRKWLFSPDRALLRRVPDEADERADFQFRLLVERV